MTPAPNAQSYHDDFIDHGRYLRAWSPSPFGRIGKGFGRVADTPLTKAGLTAWMVALCERGLTRGGINMYVRTGYSPISHTRGI